MYVHYFLSSTQSTCKDWCDSTTWIRVNRCADKPTHVHGLWGFKTKTKKKREKENKKERNKSHRRASHV